MTFFIHSLSIGRACYHPSRFDTSTSSNGQKVFKELSAFEMRLETISIQLSTSCRIKSVETFICAFENSWCDTMIKSSAIAPFVSAMDDHFEVKRLCLLNFKRTNSPVGDKRTKKKSFAMSETVNHWMHFENSKKIAVWIVEIASSVIFEYISWPFKVIYKSPIVHRGQHSQTIFRWHEIFFAWYSCSRFISKSYKRRSINLLRFHLGFACLRRFNERHLMISSERISQLMKSNESKWLRNTQNRSYLNQFQHEISAASLTSLELNRINYWCASKSRGISVCHW